MIITSKIRKMYWLKQAIGFSAGTFLAVVFFNVSIMYDGRLNFHYAPCWVAIMIIPFLIFQIYTVLNLKTIYVTEKEIIIKYTFFNKSETLLYNNIKNIERIKNQLYAKAGAINDGYHSSAVHLVCGKYFIVSPDQFENYSDLIYAIKSNMK
ncbi:MAG: hypothetical protein H7239_04605 [Flavobacterium sp.]|nr:hypothetical protein [Flavobacterium sp.]